MRRQGGFSYVIVMFLVGLLSLISVRAIESTIVAERHDLEDELLWRGMAYREAIRMYYLTSQGTTQVAPLRLDDLREDPRAVRRARPLRRMYRDPMTASGQWGLVHNADGGLIGVYSLSPVKPLKRAGFPPELAAFANAQHYSDWKFVYQP